MTPLAFAKDFITRWEDGGSTDPAKTHSMDPKDPGNWSTGKIGQGNLIGSNHGVTPAALAVHRLLPEAAITVAIMHALTVDEAAEMALSMYYSAPGLDQLPWNAVTASLLDFGWGTGPKQAIKSYQRMCGVAVADGAMGPVTKQASAAFITKHGEAEAAKLWADVRNAFYASLNQPRYIKGWTARSSGYLPGTDWWRRFHA